MSLDLIPYPTSQQLDSDPILVNETPIVELSIEYFTKNEANLTDQDFDMLLASGRWGEYKAYVEANRPTIDDSNLARRLRAHRRNQRADELQQIQSWKQINLD